MKLEDASHAIPDPQRAGSRRVADHFAGASGLLFDQAMAQTRMAVCLTDPARQDNPIIFANHAFFRLTGYEPHEVIGRNCRFLQGPDTDPESVRRLRDAVAKEDVCITEILNYRKDGTPFWNALHLGPIYGEDGRLLYYFGSQWNVSDVYAARAEEQHARMLARELSHRIKNMFSVISAVVGMTARREGAPWIAEKVNERIRALGRAYEATLDNAHTRRVVLEDVVRMVLAPYADIGRGRVRIQGPEVILDPNTVSILGLTIHEFAAHAARHGALCAPEGRVSVSWEMADINDAAVLVLGWEEEGSAPRQGTASSGEVGFGIVDALVRAAKGELQLEDTPGGFRGALRLPVSIGGDLQSTSSARSRDGGDLAGRRILIVEDEALIALEIESALHEAGATVELSLTADEALAVLDRAPVDAAILDVNLGRNATCAPVASRLRSLGTPFILHSGDLRRHGELVETLAAPVVPKPASIAEIQHALAGELQKSGSRCA